jgi:hypothetical protein
MWLLPTADHWHPAWHRLRTHPYLKGNAMNPVVDGGGRTVQTDRSAGAEKKGTDHPGSLQTSHRSPAESTGILPGQGASAWPQSHSAPGYLPGNAGAKRGPVLTGSLQRAKEQHAREVATKKEESNRPDEHGRTPLMKAAEEGNTKGIRSLLQQGADLSLQDKDGNTALFHAAKNGHDEAVRILAQHDRNLVSLRNNAGETAATVAATNGKASALITLIYSGASLYEVSDKKTLLIHAALSGDRGTLHRLVQEFRLRNESSLFPDDRDDRWESMLLEACRFSIENQCNSEISRVLIEDGLRHTSFTQKQFLLKLSEKHGNEAVVGMLLKSSPLLLSSCKPDDAKDGKQQ